GAACMVRRDKPPGGEKDQPASAMEQSLHNYMRVGLVQAVAFPASGDDPEAVLDGVEQIAADDFFAAIEVRCVPDDGLRRRVVDVLRASQLRVVYAANPRLRARGLDLGSTDDALRSRAVEAGKCAIDEAIAVAGAGTAAPPSGVAGGLSDVPRVTDVLLALFRVGFLGAGRRPLVCLRVAPRPGERPAWVIAGAKRTLAEAWARL